MIFRPLLIPTILSLTMTSLAQTTSKTEIPPLTTPTPISATLTGMSANLFIPSAVTGTLKVNFTVRNSNASAVSFALRRTNPQNCAFGPSLRVTDLKTGQVVYPRPGGKMMMCTQEIQSKTIPGKSALALIRQLDLAPGQYQVEAWLGGLSGGQEFTLTARPVKVTVK